MWDQSLTVPSPKRHSGSCSIWDVGSIGTGKPFMGRELGQYRGRAPLKCEVDHSTTPKPLVTRPRIFALRQRLAPCTPSHWDGPKEVNSRLSPWRTAPRMSNLLPITSAS